jgi:hypothetical protein
MGLIKQASEAAVVATRHPFLSATLLARMRVHFCILEIGTKRGLHDTKQWKLKVRVDPYYIEKYNAKIEGIDKEEEKRLSLNGIGIITITQGNDTRDEQMKIISQAMQELQENCHRGIFVEKKLAEGNRTFNLEEIDEAIQCACSKYPEEKKMVVADDYDPFLDEEDTGFPSEE